MYRTASALVLLCALGTNLSAQRQQRDAGVAVGFSPVDWAIRNPIQSGFYRLPGISADYRVGPGDELEIFISGYSDKSVSVTVTRSGDVVIPLVGPVGVKDRTTTEIEEGIRNLLLEKGLIKEPEVLVHVAEHVARPIYVLGDVDFPGQYMMSQQLTLMEAIFLAGGVDFPADRYGYLHRRIDEGDLPTPLTRPSPTMLQRPEDPLPGHTVLKFDLQPLKDGDVLPQDIPLRPGDVIAIPRRQTQLFYVIGAVQRPGSFEIPNQRTLRISQALASGGGPTRAAKASKGVLVRLDARGERSELSVDFNAILKGKANDFFVEPNDVIFIPGDGMKNVGQGLLGVVPGIVQTALIFY
jgi:polysaccharide export outer membrane protein